MANCNKLFKDFSEEITPSSYQRQKMKTSRKALEKKISDFFQKEFGMTISFYTQGSDAPKMKTIIIKADGTYDSDRGVYLPEKPKVSSEQTQKYVLEALNDHTMSGAQHRRKCIRVIYKSDYNIDFPVYYEVVGQSYSYLAVKGDGWIKDDPSKMIEWFEKFKDNEGQLIRLIKYIKAWASECNLKKFKMPSGIALSVWVARNFKFEKDRDDKALLCVLQGIKSDVAFSVACLAPVEPYDDLTSKLSNEQKNKFRDELNSFCEDAKKAVEENNQLKASKIWRKYFGERFGEGIDEDVDKRAELLNASASLIFRSGFLDKGGKINENSGVKHLAHRNYSN